MKSIALAVFVIVCAGCDGVVQQKPQSAPTPVPTAMQQRYQMASAGGDMFLLDYQTGKVYKYEPKDKVFLEVPVTSKILHYDSKGNLIPPDHSSFQPF